MSQLLLQEINEDQFETHWIDSTGLMFAELKVMHHKIRLKDDKYFHVIVKNLKLANNSKIFCLNKLKIKQFS